MSSTASLHRILRLDKVGTQMSFYRNTGLDLVRILSGNRLSRDFAPSHEHLVSDVKELMRKYP